MPPSCFAGEWGEWSACDATCLGEYHNPQRSRRRSPLAATGSTEGPECALEEKEGCGDSLELCAGYCWAAEWTEWSECKVVLSGGHVMFGRRRYRPIFAGAEFCDPDYVQEIDTCLQGKHNEVTHIY